MTSTPWTFTDAPTSPSVDEVVLLEGTTFCISDANGDIGMRPTSGLFVRDTRLLSGWRLSLPGRRLRPLRVHQPTPFGATFLMHSPSRPGRDQEMVIARERLVGEGMHETITVRNAGRQAVDLALWLDVDTDFADLFEVKESRAQPAAGVSIETGATLTHSVLRGGVEYAIIVRTEPHATVAPYGLQWQVVIEPHDAWRLSLTVVPRIRGRELTPHHQSGGATERTVPMRRLRTFQSSAPRIVTADGTVADVLARSVEDIATLRIFDPDQPEVPVVAAGAPWFMALFGRDSLITSMMLLPVDAGLAQGTLTILSSYLGTTTNPATDEEPGKVPHEVRFGPAGTLALDGQGTYYGSADATPLFVMALGELARWQPRAITPELIATADRALAWIDDIGDTDDDGFIEYSRQTTQGLANQGWKDSWDGINFADGRMPSAPIALAEVQAYVYAAHLARAELADLVGDTATATRRRDRARLLREAFNDTFWLPDQGWYAIGLDADKRPIDALSSNVGHCLWTGIADPEKVERMVGHLMSPTMFTGWGIRTLSSDMAAYNPMSYHNGSVWPHDTAILVAGLTRYGYREEAKRIAVGLLDAAAAFGGRLPELFSGFARDDAPVPIPYPAACSPQAWASAAPVQLITSLLGLDPSQNGLDCSPALPRRMLPLTLSRVACGDRIFDVEVTEHASLVRPSASV